MSRLPHVEIAGDAALRIAHALGALFAAQTPPISPGTSYSLSALSCTDVMQPNSMEPSGYGCQLTWVRADGSTGTVRVEPPSALAEELFDSLNAGGVMGCTAAEDPHGPSISLSQVTIAEASVTFDDRSRYTPVPPPDTKLTGRAAGDLLAALAGAAIDACDPTRALRIVCTRFNGQGTTQCGYQWQQLARVNGSALLRSCGPVADVTQGGVLDTAQAGALWQALQAAGSGDLGAITIFNADYFSWDGTTLGFDLIASSATPPP
jgi:hypothetical protein